MNGQLHVLAVLPLEKVPWEPAVHEARRAPKLVWMHGEKETPSSLPGIQDPSIQPIARHYSDTAIPSPTQSICKHLPYN